MVSEEPKVSADAGSDPPGVVLTRMYQDGVLKAEGFPLADVSECLKQPGTVVWVDFCLPSRAQLDELADELDLHDLAVEDALGPVSYTHLTLPTILRV